MSHWGDGSYERTKSATWAIRARFWDEEKGRVRRIRRDTLQKNKGDARVVVRQWFADRDRHLMALHGVQVEPTAEPAKPLDLTWSEMRDAYLDWKLSTLNGGTFEFCARKHFDAFFIEDPLWSTVGVPHIVRYQAQRRRAGASKATVRNELRMLMAVQNHGIEMGLLDQRFFTRWSVKKLLGEIPRNSYRPWSEAEYEAFIAHLPEWCRRVVEFGWLTGFRRRQIEGLDWGTHVDLERKILRPIRQKKGNQIEFAYGIIPVLEELISEQRTWAISQGYPITHGAVFRRPSACRGRPHRRRVDRLVNWRNEWNAAMEAAKKDLPEFGRTISDFKEGLQFHGLRSNLVTRLLGLGIQPELIMRLTGHRSLLMIDAYNNPDDAQFAEAMAKLDQAERERRARRHLQIA